jgi:phosphoribosyl-AMP cyclohydrolase / phosphoribosyl-ATP pyrophosphohydrolase
MEINYEKYSDGLVPAIIQDAGTRKVLMLGFMNAESFELTKTSGKVTFYSRSRQTMWTKGETSGNFLEVVEISTDCDADTILIKANPTGAVCHTGADTCFNEQNVSENFLFELEKVIWDRKENPLPDSNTSKMFAKGINKIAQKVGEEAVELVIEAKDDNEDLFKNEAADLLYRVLILLAAKDVKFDEVLRVLQSRQKK